MIHSFLRQRTLLCRTAITLRSIPVPPVQRTFSSNTPPKSNKKNLVPAPPPTSFLIPLAKSAAYLFAFGVIVRFVRPIGMLLKIPIVSAGVGFGVVAAGLRRYGNYSWKSSMSIALILVVGCGGAYAYQTKTTSASTNLTPKKEAALLMGAVKMIEAECGARVKWIKRKDHNQELVVIADKITAGGSCERKIQLSNIYVNGRLHKGIAIVTMKYEGVLFPEWAVETVYLDVETPLSVDDTVRVKIYPPKTETPRKENGGDVKGSMFLTSDNKSFK